MRFHLQGLPRLQPPGAARQPTDAQGPRPGTESGAGAFASSLAAARYCDRPLNGVKKVTNRIGTSGIIRIPSA